MLEIYYGEKDYNHFNNQNGLSIDNRDIYEIYRLAMKNSLSVACCEDLLSSFHRRTAIIHMGKTIPMPRFKTIKKNIEKYLSILNPLKTFYYHLPVEFFGTKFKNRALQPFFGTKFKNRALQPAIGVIYNIIHKLCHIFVGINPKDLTLSVDDEAVKQRLAGKDIIFTNFVSGNLFYKWSLAVKKEHGNDAGVILFAIYYDETTVDSGMQKTANPVSVMIMNATNESANVYHLIGYMPIRFPMSDKQLQDEVLSPKLSAQDKKEIMQYTYRQMT